MDTFLLYIVITVIVIILMFAYEKKGHRHDWIRVKNWSAISTRTHKNGQKIESDVSLAKGFICKECKEKKVTFDSYFGDHTPQHILDEINTWEQKND